jgi:hypothetical protein
VHEADHIIGADTEHKVGAVAMAVAVRGAEHRGGEPDDAGLEDRLPVTGDGSQKMKWSVSGFLKRRRPWRQYMGPRTLGLATRATPRINLFVVVGRRRRYD